jgi:8-oxo-dGTP pyrophosphatase MutT (NUDIX family)
MSCPHCQAEIPLFRNAVPTVDIIIETEDNIVLIKRKNPPYGWAVPGGFVDYGESFERADGAGSDPVPHLFRSRTGSPAAHRLPGLYRQGR